MGSAVLSSYMSAEKFAASGLVGRDLGSGRCSDRTTLVSVARSRKGNLCLAICLIIESRWRAYLQIVYKMHSSGEFKYSFKVPRYFET
jgi:hypothetical protein